MEQLQILMHIPKPTCSRFSGELVSGLLVQHRGSVALAD